jgi:transcriptional regulator with XRE-family HTH domain
MDANMRPDNIKALRIFLGWSQERLAREIGVSFCTVNRWERGRSRPSPMALNILDALRKRYSQTHENARIKPRKDLKYSINVRRLDSLGPDASSLCLASGIEPITAYTENISAGGIMFSAQDDFLVGDVLDIDLNIAGDKSIKAVSKVMWTRPEGAETKIGVCFIRINPNHANEIINLMLEN